MKTKILAPLFAVAFAASIGLPAAAADNASGATSFHASGPSASADRFQPLFVMSAVELSLRDFEEIAATPVVVSGVTESDLTPEDFVDATR